MDIQIHYEKEWAALYVDEKLDCVGDSRNTEERAFELLNVTVVQDDAFMCGQNQRAGVAQTLDDVAAYRNARDMDRARATELRRRAAELVKQAQELDHQD